MIDAGGPEPGQEDIGRIKGNQKILRPNWEPFRLAEREHRLPTAAGPQAYKLAWPPLLRKTLNKKTPNRNPK